MGSGNRKGKGKGSREGGPAVVTPVFDEDASTREIRDDLRRYKLPEVRARCIIQAAEIVKGRGPFEVEPSFWELQAAKNQARLSARDAGLPPGEIDHDVYFLALHGPFSPVPATTLRLARPLLEKMGDDEAVAWLDEQLEAMGEAPDETVK